MLRKLRVLTCGRVALKFSGGQPAQKEFENRILFRRTTTTLQEPVVWFCLLGHYSADPNPCVSLRTRCEDDGGRHKYR